METQFLRLGFALAWLAGDRSLRMGVFFTNLIFFTYPHPPYYGLNSGSSNHVGALVQGNDRSSYAIMPMP